MVAGVARRGAEFFPKLLIVTQKPKITVLDRDDARHQRKKSQVLVALTVQLGLLLADAFAHAFNGVDQGAHFVVLVDVDAGALAAHGNKLCAGNEFADGSQHKATHEEENCQSGQGEDNQGEDDAAVAKSCSFPVRGV